MIRHVLLYVVLFVILGLAVLSYWFGFGGVRNELLTNIVYVAAPVFSVIAGAYAVYVHGWRGSASLPFVMLALGLLLYAVGEVLWVYYDFIANAEPYPSAADYFYLLAYPAFFTGLITQVRSTGVDWKRFDPVIVFLFGIIAVLIAGVTVYFGIYLAYDSASTLIENAVAISYGVADVVIILCALLVLILAWEFKGGNLMKLYLCIFFAFAMTLVADVGFAMYNTEYLEGEWWIKNTLDTLWILQYLYLGFAFFTFAFSLNEAQKRLLQGLKRRS